MLNSHMPSAFKRILLPLLLTITFALPGVICLPDKFPLPEELRDIGSFCLEKRGIEEKILHLRPFTRGRKGTIHKRTPPIEVNVLYKPGDGQPVVFLLEHPTLFWGIKIPSSDGLQINPDLAPQIKREAEFYARLNGYNKDGVTLPHSMVLALFLDDFEEKLVVRDSEVGGQAKDVEESSSRDSEDSLPRDVEESPPRALLVQKLLETFQRFFPTRWQLSQSGDSEDSQSSSEESDQSAEYSQHDDSGMPTQDDTHFPILVFPICKGAVDLLTEAEEAAKSLSSYNIEPPTTLFEKIDELYELYLERGILANHKMKDLAVCRNDKGEIKSIIPLNFEKAMNLDKAPQGSPLSKSLCKNLDKLRIHNEFAAVCKKA